MTRPAATPAANTMACAICCGRRVLMNTLAAIANGDSHDIPCPACIGRLGPTAPAPEPTDAEIMDTLVTDARTHRVEHAQAATEQQAQLDRLAVLMGPRCETPEQRIHRARCERAAAARLEQERLGEEMEEDLLNAQRRERDAEAWRREMAAIGSPDFKGAF